MESRAPQFQVHIPRAPLSDYIELFWYFEETGELTAAKERILPTGTTELVFRLGGEGIHLRDPSGEKTFRNAVINGPQSQPFVIDRSDQDICLGVHFKPGGAFPFFGAPAGELQNRHFSLDDLWGAQAARLQERLREAPTARARFALLEDALIEAAQGRLARHRAVRSALRMLQQSPGEARIAEISENANLSPRRFIEVFEKEVGLTPKLFARVMRFQGVLARLQNQKKVDWLELALSSGYFDQAHFIRDFKAFSGLSPSAYLALRTEHQNHVPLIE
jgi:AraC-like DNA-binding protein